MKKNIIFILVATFCISVANPSNAVLRDSTQLASTNVMSIAMQKGSAGGGVPVGTIIAWPSYTNPVDAEKWLECNGQAFSPTVYPDLAAIVGNTVPDYRGLFLRGYGSKATSHYGYITHSSSSLGMIQGDAIRNITGTFIARTGLYDSSRPTTTGAFKKEGMEFANVTSGSAIVWGYVKLDASLVVPISNENRPVNKAVRYLIRALE